MSPPPQDQQPIDNKRARGVHVSLFSDDPQMALPVDVKCDPTAEYPHEIARRVLLPKSQDVPLFCWSDDKRVLFSRGNTSLDSKPNPTAAEQGFPVRGPAVLFVWDGEAK
jgi:hypothetical protein